MKQLAFYKYQGLGNDFILFDANEVSGIDYSHLAKAVCNRHFGIGADGMAIVLKQEHNWKMVFFNADGSEAPMCGNASRCVAAYLRKYHNQEEDFVLLTKGALLKMEYIDDEEISVNLGKPHFAPENVPVLHDGKEFIAQEIKVFDSEISISGVFMATSHAVVIINDFDDFNLAKYGGVIENMKIFPEKINVNFIKIVDVDEIVQKTWERGVGMTLACGTGASASAVVANKLGLTDDVVKVQMDGGKLQISIIKGEVIMQGKVKEVAAGIYFYEENI